MKGKGPTPRREAIRQENLLEFDRKYRTLKGLKSDLIGLFEKYGPDGKELELFSLRSLRRSSSDEERVNFREMLTAAFSFDSDRIPVFEQEIASFMAKYDFESEWMIYLHQLILTGIYDVPDTRYVLWWTKERPKEASIMVNRNTTVDDLEDAMKAAREFLPPPNKKHQYQKSYSSVEDPDFIDAVKVTEIDYLNRNELSEYEKLRHLYDPADISGSKKKVYDSRKKQHDTGVKVGKLTPDFRVKMSDEEFLKRGGLKGAELKRAVERIKKQRTRFKKITN